MTAQLFRVFDAAYPPNTPPPGCTGVLGYIGGGRATNIWTLSEWQRFAKLRQFPAYVPDFTTQDPTVAALDATQRMKRIGWAPFQDQRRVVVCDLETATERTWYASFAAECEQQGFAACAYGSLSTVLANAASDVWVAAWDGSAELEAGQTIHAHQYQANVPFGGTEVDFSVVDSWLFDRGGQGPRHA